MRKVIVEQQAIADKTADDLASAINLHVKEKGCCTLALSGGQSPKKMLDQLATKQIDWNKVSLFLVDERWTDNQYDQNQTMIELFLDRMENQKPTFTPLLHKKDYEANLNHCNQLAQSINYHFDIIVLGMGLDGHSASLFPDSKQFSDAMTAKQTYVKVEPNNAPHIRISMSFDCIQSAGEIFLYIPGEEKLNCLEKILNSEESNSPIKALWKLSGDKLTVYSSKD